MQKQLLEEKQSMASFNLHRNTNEIINRVLYGQVKKFQNLDVLASLIKIHNYCEKNNVQVDYRNIDGLSIKKNIIIFLFGIRGAYFVRKNKIIYFDCKAATHELLHTLSTYYEEEEDMFLSGFQIGSDYRALNEGYTELLASRIDNRNPRSYLQQVKFARLIETLFDNPLEMMQAYFDNNLDAMILKMMEVMTDDDAISLLHKEDAALHRQAHYNIIGNYSIFQRAKLYEAVVTNCNDSQKLERFLNVAIGDKDLQRFLNIKKTFSSIKNSIQK